MKYRFLCLGLLFVAVSIQSMEYSNLDIDPEYLEDPAIRKASQNVMNIQNRYQLIRNNAQDYQDLATINHLVREKERLDKAHQELNKLIEKYQTKKMKKIKHPRDITEDIPN